MNMWLRALGAHVGRGAWCETYWLPEADLVTLGKGAPSTAAAWCRRTCSTTGSCGWTASCWKPAPRLGPHCVALPAARLGAGATVGPASLVVRGDEVPESTRWQGNPIRPWNPIPAARRRAVRSPSARAVQETGA